ncbi:MAG: hypothetical protein J7L03_07665 [Caldisericaceae bacterium]|nr:hypothetical protein [Caldisericaceae bacterium]
MQLRKGTTLVEAVIAIALMALMALWALHLYSNAMVNASQANDMEIASHLASQKIEYLKTLGKDVLDNISTSSVTAFSSPYEKFGYKYIVPNTAPSGSVNPDDKNGEYIKYIEVEIYLMSDTSKPLIRMGCNFLRDDDTGENLGL